MRGNTTGSGGYVGRPVADSLPVSWDGVSKVFIWDTFLTKVFEELKKGGAEIPLCPVGQHGYDSIPPIVHMQRGEDIRS